MRNAANPWIGFCLAFQFGIIYHNILSPVWPPLSISDRVADAELGRHLGK
jgi:hypothetical protein